jgi:hypothetical protein
MLAMTRPDRPTVRPEDIRLSYTDPITGRRYGPDWGRQFTEIDGVVLEVKHDYRVWRGRGWSAEAYTDHLEVGPLVEWAEAGHAFGFAHIRRAALLEQITKYVGTEEWERKRAAWLAVPRKREWRGTYRIVRRAPRQWWALPNDPTRDSERGPWVSERAARAELGDAAV